MRAAMVQLAVCIRIALEQFIEDLARAGLLRFGLAGHLERTVFLLCSCGSLLLRSRHIELIAPAAIAAFPNLIAPNAASPEQPRRRRHLSAAGSGGPCIARSPGESR